MLHWYRQGDIITENIKTKSMSGSEGNDMKLLKKFKWVAMYSWKSSDMSGSKDWFLTQSMEDIRLLDATEIAPGLDLVKRVTHFPSSSDEPFFFSVPRWAASILQTSLQQWYLLFTQMLPAICQHAASLWRIASWAALPHTNNPGKETAHTLFILFLMFAQAHLSFFWDSECYQEDAF